ncbi:MAG: hypothetical protein ACREEW_12945 [Caulobacteraceae bacterium]
MTALALVLTLVLALAQPVQGSLTRHDLSGVGANPTPGARAPLSVRFVEDDGRPVTLGGAMGGRPTALVFADYTCTYLCGPGLVLAGAALDATHLRPGRDYSFVVVGINPRDGPASAKTMAAKELRPGAGSVAQLLSEGRADLVAAALGYRYVYDPQLRQYAHDTSIYVLAPDGRVTSVLPEFDLKPATVTAALRAAAKGRAADVLSEPLRIICYCLQPLVGAYDKPAVIALRVAGLGFLGLAVAGLLTLVLRRRRRA